MFPFPYLQEKISKKISIDHRQIDSRFVSKNAWTRARKLWPRQKGRIKLAVNLFQPLVKRRWEC